jgi:tetratricopeptide (TPR) repeat protein
VHHFRFCTCFASLVTISVIQFGSAAADPPPSEPVVARVEMRLAVGEEIMDVIEKGDLLTVIEQREEDYVIVTHDGVRGAVDKVNAVRIAESGDIYTELIEEFPAEGRYYTLRASSWWALGKPDKALADFDTAIEIGYREPHAYVSRGLFYASNGKFDQAIADYDEALKLDPESTAPLTNRAAALMGQGEFDKAITDYTDAMLKVADNDRQVRSLLRQRAIARKAAGKLDQAIEDFTTILAEDPDDFSAVMGRGYVHFQKGDAASAIADFSTAIELQPEDAVAWNNRGFNRYRAGQHAESLADYDEALRLAPKYALALQNRAWLLATSEDESVRDGVQAVESARTACEITGYENVGTLASLAAALAAAGEFDEAVGWQEKVVAMAGESDLESAQETLTRYQNEEPFADVD